ncbi:OLC1v1035701C1 [Oldenlandia corymbosa var. corymbosa]|uniref:OLC1v1035701C1 n=1 Tax=Oldenlandia corymbosa var. corymbosa TaxID=529605 RepID=A0AAV1CU38_OLDCO|nr:OLC1v1035701C1 [Oldenlandia corymbosa var. corymbosa]
MAEEEDSEVLPEEIYREILKWLPVKSLMRFQCISATWNSIIKDPTFAKSYNGGSRGLLIHDDQAFQSENSFRTNFYFSTLVGPTSQFSHYLSLSHEENKEWRATNVVDGLVCLYHRNHSWLYNIATRENLKLPDLDHRMKGSYHFGFDPASKLFKLLCIRPVSLNQAPWKCKILTIGVDSSWRDIRTSLSGITRGRGSWCSDGVIYWWNRFDWPVISHRHCTGAVAFDLVQEKFRFISLMKEDPSQTYYLPHFGTLALMGWSSVFWNGLRYKPLATHGFRRNSAGDLMEDIWVNDDLFVPSSIGAFYFEGILPNGEVLTSRPGKFPASLYLFDPNRVEMQAISVKTDPSICMGVKWSQFARCFFEENIISLKCLIPDHATVEFDSECPIRSVS